MAVTVASSPNAAGARRVELVLSLEAIVALEENVNFATATRLAVFIGDQVPFNVREAKPVSTDNANNS